jgi:hypothetical protein
MKLILFMLNLGAHSSFHYSTKNGRNLVFQWVEARQRHEFEVDYEEWSADDFRFAKDLLDQALPVPVLFDIKVENIPIFQQDGAAVARLAHTQEADGSNPSPATNDEPEDEEQPELEPEPEPEPKPKAKRGKKSIVLPSALKELRDPLEDAAFAT